MIVCSSAQSVLESYSYDVRLDEWSPVAAFPAIHKVPTVVNVAFDGDNLVSFFLFTLLHILFLL